MMHFEPDGTLVIGWLVLAVGVWVVGTLPAMNAAIYFKLESDDWRPYLWPIWILQRPTNTLFSLLKEWSF